MGRFQRWLFSRRNREGIKAWEQYREVSQRRAGANLPEEPPTLFLAGFSMGVAAAQRAMASYFDGPDEARDMAGAGRN